MASESPLRLLSEDPGDLANPVGEIVYSLEAVDLSVRRARAAFPGWSASGPKERERFLRVFQNVLKKEAKALALLITREMGKALAESEVEVDRIAQKIDVVLKEEVELLRGSHHAVSTGVEGALSFRPRGVVAVLAPFNVPAYLGCAPALSAIACGNTVVLKPSELTPFVGEFLKKIGQQAGFPDGVLNLAQGAGDVGVKLVGHPDVDGVIFTGSWETGSKIQETLLDQPQKMCALEMGGKNAAIVLKDADLKLALEEIFSGVFMTTGQRCNATSRVILEKPVAEKFVQDFLAKVESVRVGYGQDPGVTMGPVVSKKSYDKVLRYLELAKGEGFKVLREGGPASTAKRGYYLKLSVHFKEGALDFPVRDGSYADDEIFGPDVAIYAVKDLTEAIALNNRPRYGLVTSIFTKSRENYEKVLCGAETGLVNWNLGTVRSSSRLPFGGLKRSGNNRPAGFFSPFLCTIPTASLKKV